MGFPVLTVTETEGGITVRQDRFLEDGPAKPEDNETIWCALFAPPSLICVARTLGLRLVGPPLGLSR